MDIHYQCLNHTTRPLHHLSARYLHDGGGKGFERAVDGDDEDVEAISAQQARADAGGERRPSEEIEGEMRERLACRTEQKSAFNLIFKRLRTIRHCSVGRTN